MALLDLLMQRNKPPAPAGMQSWFGPPAEPDPPPFGGLFANMNKPGGFGGGLIGNSFRNNPAAWATIAAALINNHGTIGDLSGLPAAAASDSATKKSRQQDAAVSAWVDSQVAAGAMSPELAATIKGSGLGPGVMAKSIEKQLFPTTKDGFTLSPDQTRYDASGKPIVTAPSPPNAAKPPETKNLMGPDSKVHVYGFDPAKGDYSIDYGLAGPTGGNVTVNAPPAPAAGWRNVFDDNGNLISQEMIPNGPAWLAEQERLRKEKAASETGATTSAQKADAMLTAIEKAREAAKNGGAFAVGTLSAPMAGMSWTDAARVRGWVDTLKSGTALQALTALKAASATGASGFGALSEKELDILINQLGSLNPDGPPEIFLQTLDNIERQWKLVVSDIQRNVDPARRRELGLDSIIGGAATGSMPSAAGSGSTVIDGVTITPVQ